MPLTVDHTQLIEKLLHRFSIDGSVLSWLICCLENRQFFVKLDSVTSENVKLFSGVPLGSVLGSLLFNLYSQEIENIALGHNIGVHVYANDIQCYFRFDENTLLDAKNARITDFMSDLKHG